VLPGANHGFKCKYAVEAIAAGLLKKIRTRTLGTVRICLGLAATAVRKGWLYARADRSTNWRSVRIEAQHLTQQPPAKAGGLGLRTESPDTRRLNDAS
jgi:hypothetical protein